MYKVHIYSNISSISLSTNVPFLSSSMCSWSYVHFKENYLVSTLNDRSLYRVKFNSSFDRLIYIEKIYIGGRIRDIYYKENNNQILLAFEETSELGIISK